MAFAAVVVLSIITGVAAASSNDISFAAKRFDVSSASGKDTLHISPRALNRYRLKVGNRVVPLSKSRIAKLKRQLLKRKSAKLRLQSHGPAVVGEKRNWVGLDNVNGFFYRKEYTLRGLGNNIEVWVASEDRTFLGVRSVGTDFQAGDCRNGPRTAITDAQVTYLVNQFDTNILPKESAALSVAPNRNGSNALLGAPFHPAGDGDNTVVLVDNVRDENFMDLNNTQGFSYIAGFFSGQLNALFDRNIMSIDAFDWLHRTGANPPHEPVPGNNCTSAPARPFLYEGVFAHEYQHLLMSYASPGETSWVNEGLADWAQTLTGYVTPSRPITDIGFDSHIQCFLGNLGIQTPANPNPRAGGPENSLTLWGDQGDDEILCDYGAAYTLMEYLHGRYGTAFMTALHNQDANGLPGLQASLDAAGTGTSARRELHRWAMMVAVDSLLDDGRQLRGGRRSHYTAPTLDAAINWDVPDAFSEPGAPPNGSDYLRLKNSSGQPLRLSDIESLRFDGASMLPPHDIAWTVATDPPNQTGDSALYSGTGDNLDEAIVRQVTVPTTDPNLRFNAQWNLEDGWDFTFVQISTDGGATYQSVRCTHSRPTPTEDPATYPAVPNIRAHFPGFTGISDVTPPVDTAGWLAETCDLSAFAGQTVHLSFRNMTDTNTQGNGLAIPPGFWLDDVVLGSTTLSDGSSLAGWQSATQLRPIPVEGFTVQLLAYNTNTRGRLSSSRNAVRIATLRLNRNFDARVSEDRLEDLLGERNADFVGAVVMYDESTESIGDYAPYTLTVRTETRRGGDDDDDDDDDDRRRKRPNDD